MIPPPTPAPALAGSRFTFEASATGGTDLQYKWDFDDGTPVTNYTSSPAIDHVFANPGIYYVTVTAIDSGGFDKATTVVVTVHLPLTANRPAVSSNLVVEDRATGSDRLWVVNQDNDSVSVFDTETNTRIAEIPVGIGPRALAIAPNGEVWVTNKLSATISVIDPSSLAVTRTISMPFASQPFGIAAAPTGGVMYVALEGVGRLLKIDAGDDTTLDSLGVGPNPRHVSVTSEAIVSTCRDSLHRPCLAKAREPCRHLRAVGAEIVVVNGPAMSLSRRHHAAPQRQVRLRETGPRHSELPGRSRHFTGRPVGLGSVEAGQRQARQLARRSGLTLRIPSGPSVLELISQPTTRFTPRASIMTTPALPAQSLHDRLGVYMFVALETSREVAVVDAHGGWEIFRLNTGRAPQGLALSVDGRTLYVNNFMDRTISVFDISTLLDEGIADVPLVATRSTINTDKLSAQVLQGKRLFYDAKDPRLARDGYISCASCHNDGGQDGRVWDLTGFGEGLRNTVKPAGPRGAQGLLHWSNNFNEVQDFEGQIRASPAAPA